MDDAEVCPLVVRVVDGLDVLGAASSGECALLCAELASVASKVPAALRDARALFDGDVTGAAACCGESQVALHAAGVLLARSLLERHVRRLVDLEPSWRSELDVVLELAAMLDRGCVELIDTVERLRDAEP